MTLRSKRSETCRKICAKRFCPVCDPRILRSCSGALSQISWSLFRKRNTCRSCRYIRMPRIRGCTFRIKDRSRKRGFKVIGAAAFPAEHSIVNSIGARRPNKADLKEASEYGISLNRIIKKKILSLLSIWKYREILLTENTEKRTFPKADVSLCTECSACAKICPAGAISLDNPKKTDHDKCIGCMKCVRFCKQKARYVSAFKLNMAAKKLTKVCQSDKKAEIFL